MKELISAKLKQVGVLIGAKTKPTTTRIKHMCDRISAKIVPIATRIKLVKTGFQFAIGFIILNIIDMASTYHVLQNHIGFEGNPLYVYLFERYGIFISFIPKMLVVLLISGMMIYFLSSRNPKSEGDKKVYLFGANLIIIMYLLIVTNNLLLVIKGSL